MSATSLEKLDAVFCNGLCTRCGTCVGLSDGAVEFVDRSGTYLPERRGDIPAELADRIWRGCSAASVSFPDINAFVFGSHAKRHPYLGHTESIDVAFACDPAIRRAGASGGLLSTTLLWLLNKGRIDGAVVTRMSAEQPWLAESVVARTRAEILSAAQSKYVITSVNEILPAIGRFDGMLAYVGLPCQVHGIRKLQMAGDPSVRNIKYVLGPFCGNTLHHCSIRTLLRAHGHSDLSEIASLTFREGEWPGNMRIELTSGERIQLPKFHANYLIPFSIMKRCLLCTDLTNEFTDISGGDAWAPVYEERGKGFSIALGRTKAGQEILDAMSEEQILEFKPLSVDDAIAMHTHGYDLKKRGAFIRIGFRRMLGKPVPDYGYKLTGFSFRRYGMEAVIVTLFGLLGTRCARSLVERIKPATMGRVFERLRAVWKRATRGIKRKALHD